MAKISTLIDLFNGSVLDTNKWFENRPPGDPDPDTLVTVSGGNVNIYRDTTNVTLTSIDQFDWQNSDLILGAITGRFTMNLGGGGSGLLYRDATNLVLDTNFGTITASETYNSSTMKYIKISRTTSSTSVYYSANNYNWTLFGTYSGTPPTTYPFAIGVQAASQAIAIGAVNPGPNLPPDSELTSPGDLEQVDTTTPVLTFKAVDVDADNVTYQVQIATDIAFTSLHEDKLSASDTGFSGTDPYTSNTSVTYTVQSALTDGSVTYYWRVRAKDPAGTNTWGSWTSTQILVSRPFAPSVTSGASSSVASTTATTTGEVTSDGGAMVTERGVAYGTSADPTIAGSKVISGSSTGTFGANLTGLATNTIYNWRAYGTNVRDTSYGANKTFTTLTDTPTASAAYDITDSGAKVDATVAAGGGAAITERGAVYSISPNPTLANSSFTSGTGSGSYTVTLTGLAELTTYYVRTYATNASGTSYSSQISFTTDESPSEPTLITGTIENIALTSADVVDSEVTLDGTSSVTERGVVYSYTVETPTTADDKEIEGGTGLGQFDASLTGLEAEKLYYVRAYAINAIGTGYGPVQTFTTLSPFITNEGDGYWTWKPDGSNAHVGRSQSTDDYSSANLLLSDLNLEDGETYTLWYSGHETDNGEPTMILQWYDNLVKQQQVISASTPYTFVYDTAKLSWAIRLFVTRASTEADPINAIFRDMYLAKEASFSGYIPFIRKGLTEVKIENNWILDTRREDTIEDIFNEVEGVGWRQFTANTTGLGWLEVGDLFTITDDSGTKEVIVWETKLTVDPGVKETLSSQSPKETETDYNKAGSITKTLRRTQISVDKNDQVIESLVEDVYNIDGVVNTKFTEVEQDIDSVRTTVQSSGGVNLVRNSVMYAFSDDGVPDHWTVAGTGSLLIQASPESLSGGGISGNVFTLSDETVSQNVTVRKDVDFIAEDQKLYYSFSARVRKNTVGVASITLSNRNETHIIELPDQQEYYWEAVSIETLLPLDDHFDITIQSDADANLQVTDVMLSPGDNIRQWTQSNGEAMNTNVAITDDGMTIRSNVFRNDYTKIDALGFEVHKHEAGGDRVFGFNGDETNVRKLRADNQLSIATIRMVPVQYDSYNGIAFTRTEDN